MNTQRPSTSFFKGGVRFPQTLWSIVLMAGGSDSTQSEKALSHLCQAYWYPIYGFLRQRGHKPHEAEDLTQSFFLHLLEKEGFSKAKAENGKFRSFLLGCLKNFLADEWRRSHARKRGGHHIIQSLDLETAEARFQSEPADHQDPEKLFEARWAMALLDRVLARLEAEYVQAGKQNRFKHLEPFITAEPTVGAYAQIAESLSMTQGAVKVAVLRLRQRYRDLLQEEIAGTVSTPEEFEAEMRHLLTLLLS